MEFKNRTALLTGGTGALGVAVALELLAAGASVAVPYRSEKEWEALRSRVGKSSESLLGIRADLTRSDEVEQCVAQVTEGERRLDFLVAVAGGYAAGKSFETDERTWEQMLNLNLRILTNCLRAVVPRMIEQNFGRIVTVSSGAILRGGGAGMAAYAVSKGAVRQLSEILADEVQDYDIRVHCVMPGTMDTKANRLAMPKADFAKWVKTEDVAKVIHFLLSNDARAIRSVTVPVLG
jgi:NAD(P)-dependent dehydrogenase (short-subunit alcohol dehydrogenase family)